MKKKLVILFLNMLAFLPLLAQRVPQVPDSIRRKYKVMQLEEREAARAAMASKPRADVIDFSKYDNDSLLRLKLIELALAHSAEIKVSNANMDMSEAQLKYAKSSWLNSVSAGANVNEFVINNSPAASFFPKYNVGVAIPLDIFSRVKKDKALARGNIDANLQLRESKVFTVREEVQIRYENYKEMKEVLMLQQESLEYDITANEAAKKAYSDGEIKLEDMNKAYQVYLAEKAKMASKRRNFNAAKIALEEYIGLKIIDQQ